MRNSPQLVMLKPVGQVCRVLHVHTEDIFAQNLLHIRYFCVATKMGVAGCGPIENVNLKKQVQCMKNLRYH